MTRSGRRIAFLAGAIAVAAPSGAFAFEFRWPWEKSEQPAVETQAGPAVNERVVLLQRLPPPRPAAARTPPAEVVALAPQPAMALAAASATAVPAAVPAQSGRVGPDNAEAGLPATEREVVERANAYFNGISALTGSFLQIGGDGRRMTGKLYVQRPGKIRFEYDAPATLDVVSDGSSVAVRDRKLATQDLYPVSQTPLKFLVGEKVELGRDIRVIDVVRNPAEARVVLEDRSTLGGTSRITLHFDPRVAKLDKWRIVDPQGFETTVVLSGLERIARVDPRLFVINYERVLGEDRMR